jgi:hypothetical protein
MTDKYCTLCENRAAPFFVHGKPVLCPYCDRDPRARIEAHGIRCDVGIEYLYYRGVDINDFRLPREADWAKIRLCVDDAERRSKRP